MLCYLNCFGVSFVLGTVFPIFLNVSIAVNHVPSAAPLSGLTHRQVTHYAISVELFRSSFHCGKLSLHQCVLNVASQK
ncbi:hypothetical protein T07_11962 [Trichinella nelsoni]|uniref:Uncharacterized protein n=1 Tax=Trichinella nelsoni TaxID=6336 RepID=A0A0V0S763_9BILA|nr:hypothetical protein T07_11962 [Trichinella nelsoni]